MGRSQDERGGANGDDAALGKLDAVIVTQDAVHEEGTRVAGSIAKYVLQVPTLVALNADDAMLRVNTGVNGVNGTVDGGAQHFSTKDVVTHVERNDLLVVEDVLYDYNAALFLGILLFVKNFLTLSGTQFADPQAYGKLLAAVLALEDQLLALLILRLIEGDETLTFGTSYSFHYFTFRIQALSMSGLAAFRDDSAWWAEWLVG